MPKQPALPSKIILTSTKAYFSPARTVTYLHSILDPSNNILSLLKSHSQDVRFVYIPDFIGLYPSAQILHTKYSQDASTNSDDPWSPSFIRGINSSKWPISLGAQDVYPSDSHGAYTGEITIPSLTSLGVTVVEINHAERRRYLHETDSTAAQKAKVVSEAGMIPLVCIGELASPNLSGPMSANIGKAMGELKPQIETVLAAVDGERTVVFAYEPVWAIGAAQPAPVEYVGAVVQAIRQIAKSARGKGSGEIKVVYGGSAGPGLWSGKANSGQGLGKYVDGLFLGRFAHEIEGVRGVVEEVCQSLGKE
jgi:triosephosphate isomerase (TIM)